MKYIIIDDCGIDLFTDEFSTKEEAFKNADRIWCKFSEHDKNRRNSFCVIESANEDENAENHLDGNVLKSWK